MTSVKVTMRGEPSVVLRSYLELTVSGAAAAVTLTVSGKAGAIAAWSSADRAELPITFAAMRCERGAVLVAAGGGCGPVEQGIEVRLASLLVQAHVQQ